MNEKIRLLIGILLGSLFAYAGILKVLDPIRFFADIQKYDMLPWWPAAVALAFFLPWIEIACGFAVTIKPLRLGALFVLAALLLVFMVALTQAWARGLDISCGCFREVRAQPRYLLWIGRDLGLLILTLVLATAEWGARKSAYQKQRQFPPA